MRSKVLDNARDLGLDVNLRRVSDTRVPAADTAAAVGCGASRIVACAVFVADGDPVVCVTSAECEIDADLLADALDVAEVRPASGGETRAATGFPASGLPPLGHGLPVVVDAALLAHATVWTAAGDGHTLVELAPERLADCTAATVATVTSANG